MEEKYNMPTEAEENGNSSVSEPDNCQISNSEKTEERRI